ncbi:DUF368 domain-containing protein [Candidatus Woesearchaeota archaeon]|nr:DUF368 domain-containing protein [Candidatus Woesearchaeota archaeon]
MGIADAIPGVSGGTIALITGIYDRLITAINGINKLFVKEVFNRKVDRAFKNIKKIDFALFVPLLLGIMLAMFSLSHVMSYLLSELTAITYAFFFGLILSSAFFVYKQADKDNFKKVIFLLIGFVFAFWFVGLKALEANHSTPIIILAGAIAICAMILPGISGAFILVLLNQYEFMINSIKNLLWDKMGLFIAGAIVGILSFSKLLNYLLKKHRGKTMSFLTGLMLGSLRLPYGRIVESIGNLAYPIVAAIVGFGIVFVLEKKFR